MSRTRGARPRRLTRVFLRLLMSREDLRVAESELAELHERRRFREGARAADAWLERQWRGLPRRLLAARFRGAGHPGTPSARGAGERMQSLVNDGRQALRGLRRAPVLAATFLLTVGLGIGATTTLFAVIHAVLVAPLPYPEPGRLVRIYTDAPPHRWPLSVVDYRALEEQQTRFAAVAGYQNTAVTFSRGDRAERLRAKIVTASYFPLLGVTPVLGRAIHADECRPGGPRAVVVSHGFWSRWLGGDPSAVGKPIRLDGLAFTVVGVLPPGPGPLEAGRDLFLAAQWAPPERKGPFFIRALGRLGPGVAPATATAELRSIDRRLFPLWKTSYQDEKATWGLVSLKREVVGDAGPIVLVAFGAVVLVLLLACANAANLLLARGARRQGELAVRGALGASRSRLLQHVLVESAVLATGAAILGALLAALAFGSIRGLGGDVLPRAGEVGWTGPVIAFLAAVTVGSALLSGLVPSLQAAHAPLDLTLRTTSPSTTEGVGARRVRRVLVAAEFAIATPLLVGAGLLVASLAHLQAVDPGFDTRGLVTARLTLPSGQYQDAGQVRAFWKEAESRLATIPGVAGVAFADARPPRELPNIDNFDLEDDPTPPGGSQPAVPWVSVTPAYFRVLGLRLRAGRLLGDRDAAWDPPAVVVDAAWAARFFPGRSALGRRFHEGGCTTCPWITVVGVVGAVKYQGLDAPDRGTIYAPFSPGQRARYLLVRVEDSADGVVPAIRQRLRGLDASVPLSNVATADALLADSLERPRSLSWLVGAFAVVALLLAAIGVYGILAHFVQQHSREIGIRLALGGRPRQVEWMILGSGLKLVGWGVAVGITGAAVLARALSGLLYGVAPGDPAAFLGVALLLVATALGASLLATRRAVALDPAAVLREE